MLDNFDKYIDVKNIIAPKNKLEAICLLSTGKESEQLKNHIINEIVNNTNQNDLKFSRKLDFIILNSINHTNKFSIDKISNIFKTVKYSNIKINKNQDFYFHPEQVVLMTEEQKSKYCWDYGQKSGPNYSFFRALEKMKRYNSVLFLESDCFLKPNWIANLYNYTIECNGFWVSGAKYSGTAQGPMQDRLDILNNHINGGVCLYATGDPYFQQIMKLTEDFLKYVVNTEAPHYPYDFIIPIMIWSLKNLNIKNSYQLAKIIDHYHCFNNLICNLSTNIDSKIKNKEIHQLYNYYILHKKPFNYQQFTKT